MKPFYEFIPKNKFYQVKYEMSVSGSLLSQLMKKHGISPSAIRAKGAHVDWLLEGFPETPVDVIRIIAGKLCREEAFVRDLRDHWLEAADSLEKASMTFRIYAEMSIENDFSFDPYSADADVDELRFDEPEPVISHVGTWQYSFYDSQNEASWIGEDGQISFHSVSAVSHRPAKETLQIEYAGKAIQILPGVIDPKDYPCLKEAEDGNYRLEPDIPSASSFTAADGLAVTFLWDRFRKHYEKLFGLISLISDIAYKDDVSAAQAESDLLRKMPYGAKDQRVVSGCGDTVVSAVKDFLQFSRDLNGAFQGALQEAADNMIRKKNGKLSTTRVWNVRRHKYSGLETCPFSFNVDCKPVSENDADLRIFYSAATPEGTMVFKSFLPPVSTALQLAL